MFDLILRIPIQYPEAWQSDPLLEKPEQAGAHGGVKEGLRNHHELHHPPRVSHRRMLHVQHGHQTTGQRQQEQPDGQNRRGAFRRPVWPTTRQTVRPRRS